MALILGVVHAQESTQMVFQNPDGALNRAVTVGRTLQRSLSRLAGNGDGNDAALRDLAALVRLAPATSSSVLGPSPAG